MTVWLEYKYVSHVYAWSLGGQKRALYLLELELAMAVSHYAELGTKPGSSVGAKSALNLYPALQPDLHLDSCERSCFFYQCFHHSAALSEAQEQWDS